MLEKIKQEYLKVHGDLIKDKKLLKPTSLGYSGSASADTIHEFFKKIGLDKYSSFADLGSGEGKVVLIASLFTKSFGIEIDEELIGISNNIKKKLKLDNAAFLYGDFLDMDLTDYDILFINPDQPMYEAEKKLRREMTGKQKLIVFGGLYKPLNMKLVKEFTVQNAKFFVYKND
ncbi:MAG: methyltransferase domain-containing protein [Nanoarchaeota archaeon]|nr:methyltransferase domain-containing protein [Nanoarchaeota archaeon]